MKKVRLDNFLVNLGYFDNKSKASANIMAGNVQVDEVIITKAGHHLDTAKNYEIKVKTTPFVSRGGLKLQKAVETFNVDIKNRICLDAGASTGGFTDCLLQNGAQKIYAVDVGYGQIDWKLRSNDKVKVIERTNIKNCDFSQIYLPKEPIADLAVMDLSFISLKKVLPNIKTLLKENHEIIALIKPQFEVGKEHIAKGGVVKEKNAQARAIYDVIDFAKTLGYNAIDLTYSPLKGPAGNCEYLIHLSTETAKQQDFLIKNIVNEANT
ncbi:MAG TPA: TlyA family RNA methyltransferase [Candidatus Gastranaerophilaceae bacterium]|nr:TlyA family RNA methyltransferase [Candidatus Gastranaerophilaceae bacterium]